MHSWKRNREAVVIGLTEHLGDIVAAQPIVAAIREKHPNADIYWVIKKQFLPLVRYNPEIAKPIIVSCLSDWIRLKPLLSTKNIFDLHVPGRVCLTEGLEIGLNKNAPDLDVDNYYNHGSLFEVATKLAGLQPLHDQPKLFTKKVLTTALNLPKRYIAVHTRSQLTERDWTDEKWKLLADTIYETTGVPCLEVGLSESSVPAGKSWVSLTGKTTLEQMMEVIRLSQAFIGIDSGPAHIANAFEKPAIILLGTFGSFHTYMPYSGHFTRFSDAKIIHYSLPARDIPVHTVVTAFQQIYKTQIQDDHV